MVKNFSANNVGSDSIAIITIDDKSLDKIRWPWKRDLYGKMFNYLHEYTKAKVIGFDAIIATPDKDNLSADESFYRSVKNVDNLVVGFSPSNTPYSSKAQGSFYDKQFKD